MPLHQQLREALHSQGKNPRDLFKLWDDSGDGKLDKHEMAELMLVLCGMTLSDSELNKLFKSFDSDDSGYVSFAELNVGLHNKMPKMRAPQSSFFLVRFGVSQIQQK